MNLSASLILMILCGSGFISGCKPSKDCGLSHATDQTLVAVPSANDVGNVQIIFNSVSSATVVGTNYLSLTPAQYNDLRGYFTIDSHPIPSLWSAGLELHLSMKADVETVVYIKDNFTEWALASEGRSHRVKPGLAKALRSLADAR